MRLFLCGGGIGEKTIEVNRRLNEIIDLKQEIKSVRIQRNEFHFD